MSNFNIILFDNTRKKVEIPQNINTILYSKITNENFYHTEDSSPYTLQYLIEGKQEYKIKNNNFRLNSGEYLFINYGSKVEMKNIKKYNNTSISIFFREDLIKDVYKNYYLSDEKLLENKQISYPPQFIENGFVNNHKALDLIIKNIEKQILSTQNTFFTEDLFYNLADKIWRFQTLVYKQVQLIQSKKYSTKLELYRRLCNGRDYILDNYQEYISIEDIARVACLSNFHFIRLFGQVFGTSPHKYLNKYRIDKAAYFLENTNKSVNEICHEIGFSDPTSFIRLFKRHYRYTPAQYRKEVLS